MSFELLETAMPEATPTPVLSYINQQLLKFELGFCHPQPNPLASNPVFHIEQCGPNLSKPAGASESPGHCLQNIVKYAVSNSTIQTRSI